MAEDIRDMRVEQFMNDSSREVRWAESMIEAHDGGMRSHVTFMARPAGTEEAWKRYSFSCSGPAVSVIAKAADGIHYTFAWRNPYG